MARKPEHMRRFRIGAGLTQGEMAHLLGSRSPGTVYNFEAGLREPDLRTVFAYRVMFGVPAEKLCPGVYKEVEDLVINRVHELSEAIRPVQGNPAVWHKRRLLADIAERRGAELERGV